MRRDEGNEKGNKEEGREGKGGERKRREGRMRRKKGRGDGKEGHDAADRQVLRHQLLHGRGRR